VSGEEKLEGNMACL